MVTKKPCTMSAVNQCQYCMKLFKYLINNAMFLIMSGSSSLYNRVCSGDHVL